MVFVAVVVGGGRKGHVVVGVKSKLHKWPVEISAGQVFP